MFYLATITPVDLDVMNEYEAVNPDRVNTDSDDDVEGFENHKEQYDDTENDHLPVDLGDNWYRYKNYEL